MQVKKKRNRPYKDYTGLKFGRLTAIESRRIGKEENPKWLWLCDCGNTKEIAVRNVAKGGTSSCGCIFKEMLIARNTTHGLRSSKSYKSWQDMKARCTNPKNKEFKNYGERGITYCESWSKFENFYADMGEKPDNFTLDRIDVNKGYFKENCRWANLEDQANNKRNTVKIDGKSIAQIARSLNKSCGTIAYRLKNNLNPSFSGDYRK